MSEQLRIGSLCSGFGGLEMSVQEVLGGELAWVADPDPGAALILAHRFPTVKNLGDITTVDWATVEPVDILTAGWPCPPVSMAGRRKGIHDERWLFDDICTAIGRMVTRPRLLVLENVAGLLSANDGDAMARVVYGLAALGYEFAYRLVRASDAGAAHRRERWFCVAWLAADTADARCGRTQDTGADRGDAGARAWAGEPQRDSGPSAENPNGAAGSQWWVAASGETAGGWAWADASRSGGTPAPTDTEGDGWDERRPEPARLIRGSDAPVSGDGTTPDADSGGFPERTERDSCTLTRVNSAFRDDAERHGETPADTDSAGGEAYGDSATGTTDWGAYGPAIARWEAVLGQPAPPPTEPGRTGQRLSPAFVEFLMGLPDGWVTDVPGLSRNAQLKALGNGCVPQQVVLALRLLLPTVGR